MLSSAQSGRLRLELALRQSNDQSVEFLADTDLARQAFAGVRIVIDDYIRQTGLTITPAHDADNLAMAISLVASTRGFALLPRYAQNFLPWSVVARPLVGEPPTIDIAPKSRSATT